MAGGARASSAAQPGAARGLGTRRPHAHDAHKVGGDDASLLTLLARHPRVLHSRHVLHRAATKGRGGGGGGGGGGVQEHGSMLPAAAAAARRAAVPRRRAWGVRNTNCRASCSRANSNKISVEMRRLMASCTPCVAAARARVCARRGSARAGHPARALARMHAWAWAPRLGSQPRNGRVAASSCRPGAAAAHLEHVVLIHRSARMGVEWGGGAAGEVESGGMARGVMHARTDQAHGDHPPCAMSRGRPCSAPPRPPFCYTHTHTPHT